MTNVQHQKFLMIITQVEALEDKLMALEKANADATLILDLKERLAYARNELERVSNGCGTGKNPS